MYKLNKPLTAIENGEVVSITELDIPDTLTVGQLRKGVKTSQRANGMLFMIELAATIAGLNKASAAQLEMPDVVGYLELTANLLEGAAPQDVNVGAMRPVRALVARITASAQDNPIEWGAQVLQHGHGWALDKVNEMPAGDLLALIPELLESFFTIRPA